MASLNFETIAIILIYNLGPLLESPEGLHHGVPDEEHHHLRDLRRQGDCDVLDGCLLVS